MNPMTIAIPATTPATMAAGSCGRTAPKVSPIDRSARPSRTS
jgi:hypothetical protein